MIVINDKSNEALIKLTQFFKQLESLTTGDNNFVDFEVRAYEVSGSNDLSQDEIVRKVYGAAMENNLRRMNLPIADIQFVKISFEDMTVKITKIIPVLDGVHEWANLHDIVNAKEGKPLVSTEPAFDYTAITTELLETINNLVDCRNSTIWDIVLPTVARGIIWDFNFIIYNPHQNIWVYLSGNGND